MKIALSISNEKDFNEIVDAIKSKYSNINFFDISPSGFPSATYLYADILIIQKENGEDYTNADFCTYSFKLHGNKNGIVIGYKISTDITLDLNYVDYQVETIDELLKEIDSYKNNKIQKAIDNVQDKIEYLQNNIRHIPDFPKRGVILRDLTMCYANAKCMDNLIDIIKAYVSERDFDAVIGIDAKGFIFSSIIAYLYNKPLILVRKKGKLPGKTIETDISTEYSNDTIELDIDSIAPYRKFLFLDDVLATGGTTIAVNNLLKKANPENKIIYSLFIIELDYLSGRNKILSNLGKEFKYDSVIHYEK